ncbi:receptor-like protein kinase 7 [Zingiber officinale]|uniref:receptor-like protein kinase 7 n=1 Tax=Zingiber officinale TaxID=94328 RepID=UPI001C4B1D26|nr:receptor-like protein kinase 7 [Zingiber officinale]
MARQEGYSTARLPLFSSEDFGYWKGIMEYYLKTEEGESTSQLHARIQDLPNGLHVIGQKVENRDVTSAGITCDSDDSVSEIDLTDIGISGEIRFDIVCWLPSLIPLSPGSNELSDDIPDALHSCTSLRRLDLAFGSLRGVVPEMTTLVELQINFTSYYFTGAFPWSSLAGLTELEVLSVGDNSFDPNPFPDVVLNLTKLNWLYLSNCNIHGQIPPAIGNLTKLINIEIADRFLTGVTPRDLQALQSVGSLLEIRSLTNLISLQLFDNNFSGEVPLEFGDFRLLTNLTLYSNRFIGKLPAKLGSWTKFNFINVSSNSFTGPIPTDMCRKGTMKRLLMMENKFTREIAAGYAYCSSLLRFRKITLRIGRESLKTSFIQQRIALETARESLEAPFEDEH